MKIKYCINCKHYKGDLDKWESANGRRKYFSLCRNPKLADSMENISTRMLVHGPSRFLPTNDAYHTRANKNACGKEGRWFEEKPIVKQCKDCKHSVGYEISGTNNRFYHCKHKKCGNEQGIEQPCNILRSVEGKCGLDAKYFKPKANDE